jgi:hypothetical protein
MNLILGGAGDARIPLADEGDVLVDALGLDVVELDRVHVLAAGEHLAEAGLDLGVQLAALLGAVDEVGQRARLARGLVVGSACRVPCAGRRSAQRSKALGRGGGGGGARR